MNDDMTRQQGSATRHQRGATRTFAGAVLVPAILIMMLFIPACEDHGLAPGTEGDTPGIGGLIRVRSTWPPQDSVRDLRIAAFRSYPPKDILTEVVSGTAVFSELLPYGVDSIPYRIQSESMNGVYGYVVVAQNYGPDPFQQWKAVGVYTLTGDVTTPSPVDLASGRFLPGIDVEVDFINLPPQPF
ncbi:MAG: hypothetical protein KFF77_02310 [Bacteroidetes bacterium]|nr:hypothetical protein [Bacteroidota bacterium]